MTASRSDLVIGNCYLVYMTVYIVEYYPGTVRDGLILGSGAGGAHL